MYELTPYVPYLLAAYAAFAVGILSPGPNILAIVGASMGTSRRAGLAIACGISTGSLLWATLAVLGLTAVLANFAWFGTLLRILGGCYLLWLASKYLRSARHAERLQVVPMQTGSNAMVLFFQGLAIQMTNPKAAMHWLSIMTLIVRPDVPVWVGVAMIAGTGVIAFGGHLAWALLFSTARVVDFYHAFKRVLDAVIGGFFVALGLGLIFSALKNGSKA